MTKRYTANKLLALEHEAFFFTTAGNLTPQLTTFNPNKNYTLLLMGRPQERMVLPLSLVYRKPKDTHLNLRAWFGRRGERSHQGQRWCSSCSCVESHRTTEPRSREKRTAEKERRSGSREENKKCFSEDTPAWKATTQCEYRTSVSTGGCVCSASRKAQQETEIHNSPSLWTHPVFTQHLACVRQLAGESWTTCSYF